MLETIKSLFSRGAKSVPPPPASVLKNTAEMSGQGLDLFETDADPGDYGISRYPPIDQGIPRLGINPILRSQQDLLERIFRSAGVSREDFDKYYQPPIRNLAAHIHLLPATSTTYFRGTGGLFRMSLEIALNSLQSANAAVFPVTGGVERRFYMTPKWLLATFLAGLCCQNYRTINSMVVMTRDNQQWTPLLTPLYQWATDQKVDVYFVRWMDDFQVHGAQASAAYSISQVIPHEVLQWLASDNNQIVPSMTAAVAGVEANASENPISRLVAPVVTRVIEDDLKKSATNYGHLVIGAHLEMHLVDAMRRLVRSGKWIPNNQNSGGRLWIGAEGVFVDWTQAAQDIANLLSRDSFTGIPRDPDTLCDLLVNTGLLKMTKRNTRYWTITIPTTLEMKEGMVRLAKDDAIFPAGFDLEQFRSIALTLSVSSQQAHVQPASNTGIKANVQIANSVPDQGKQAAGDATPVPKPKKQKEPASQDAEHKQPAQSSNAGSSPAAEKKPDNKNRNPNNTNSKAKPKSTEHAPAENAAPSDKPVPAGSQASGEPENLKVIGQSESANRLLGSLKRGNAFLLQEVVEAYTKKTLTGMVATLPHGVGISHDELSAHGQPVMDLLEELAIKQWLWQDKTRLSKRIHQVDINGQSYRMMILKPDVAAGLGFEASGA